MKYPINVVESDSPDELNEMKLQYVQSATAPLDGMWLCGFVPQATHYRCLHGYESVGYYCIDDSGYLLHFFLKPEFQGQASSLFGQVVAGGKVPSRKIKGVFVSTAEPFLLSLCLDHFCTYQVNALMYQLNDIPAERRSDAELGLVGIVDSQLPEAVEFAVASIGAPAEWLKTYYTNLIRRKELFGVWENQELIATGESRGYDAFQVGYADLGVIVAKSERGRGLATRILKQLVAINQSNQLLPICSTEKSNVAAQIAIERSGFIARNRIIQFLI